MNSAEKETQAILNKMETEVTAQYQKAVDEIAEKIEKFYKAYETKEAKWQEMVDSGVKTEKEFKAWRQNQYAMGKRWEQMKETLSNDLYNSNKIARSIVNGYTPDVYATNFNYATYQIEKGAQINTQFTLYNHEAVERLLRDNPDLLPISTLNELKDKAYNRKLLQSVAIQGILQGESIPKLAKRVADTCGERNRKAAIRNARTIVTSAQNGGRVDAFKRAQNLGVDMMQEWRAVFDNRTRHSHRQLDGERRKVGEPFSNGLLYPADPNGAPEEVYNCRCNIKGVVKGLESRAIKYRSNEAVGVSYEEWKKGKTRPQMRPKDLPKHKTQTPKSQTHKTETKGTRRRPPRQQLFSSTKYQHYMKNDFDEFKKLVDDAPTLKLFNKYADDVEKLTRSKNGKYRVYGKEILWHTNNIDGISKYHTLAHESGHHFDYMMGRLDKLTYNEADLINKASPFDKLKPLDIRPSVSDKFLNALREDMKILKPYVDDGSIKRHLEMIDGKHPITGEMAKIYDSAKSASTSGVQDAVDGFFGTQDRFMTSWGHGEAYYVGSRSEYAYCKKMGWHKEIKEIYKNELGYNVKTLKDSANIFRQYRASGETWANITSAITCGGSELEAVKEHLPNAYKAYLEIIDMID